MGAHSLRSPSGADRWMICSGSVFAEAPYPDETSEWAAEGTVLHEIAAQCVEFGFEPHDFVGRVLSADGYSFEISKEHADCMLPGLDFIREQPGDVYVEYAVDLGAWLPARHEDGTIDEDGEPEKGTLDIGIIIIVDGWVIVFDWKFGKGLKVSPVFNKQLMLYALGFWDNVARHKIKKPKFKLIIEQPRVPGAGGSWECSLETLLKFGEEASERHALTFDPKAPRTASEKGCYYCKAAMNADCDEYHQYNLDLVGLKFDSLDDDMWQMALDDPDTMTPERRSTVALHKATFVKWIDRVHDRVKSDTLAGAETPGAKAVLGRWGDRTWANQEAAEAELKRMMGPKKAYNQSLKSPTQVEKELGTRQWKKVQELIHRPEPRPVLVPESDDREPIRPVTDLFDDDTEDLI